MSRENPTDVIIFDFDGTIVDSMPFLTRAAVSLLTGRYGMTPEDARKAYVDTCGLPFVKQMEIVFPGDDRNQATVRDFEAQKHKHLLDFALFPDVVPAVARIRACGIKVCVSSGNIEDLIAKLLRSKGLVVDLIMGFRPEFEKGLDHFRFAAETFGSPFDRLVFVGDSQRDGLTAKQAGIRFIARAGLLSAERLREVLPGVPIVNSLEQVLPLLGIKTAQEGRWVDATS